MDCSLNESLKKEHTTMKNPKLSTVLLQCPLVGKQICLWCCLHISDASDAMTRNHTLDMYPKLSVVETIIGIRFDEMSETCSRCSVKT